MSSINSNLYSYLNKNSLVFPVINANLLPFYLKNFKIYLKLSTVFLELERNYK